MMLFIDSAEVKEWLKELDGYNIPNIAPTVDGTCTGSPAAASNASAIGWWTCGGYTRDTDIVTCPNKMTWGISFDDGPSTYSKFLLGLDADIAVIMSSLPAPYAFFSLKPFVITSTSDL